MSLVERALKKLQESRTGSTPRGAPLDGSLPAMPRAEDPAPIPAAYHRPITQPLNPEPAPTPVQGHLVHIDRAALRELELLPPMNLERLIASQYQHVKRPLVTSALGKAGSPVAANSRSHLIMMTSALPGEGKTFTSINLALSMALEKDVQVLLIDADVVKPRLSRIFGLEDRPGLLDLLVDSSLRAESLILPTDVKGLSILPAGRPRDTSTELIASARMEQIAAELGAGRRRILLFDSPPLLLTTEARAMVPVMGQVVLVIRAEVTSRSAVVDALDAIGENTPISLILNQTSAAPSTGYYGYGSYSDEPAAEEQ